jgi:hypothetical protein
MGILLVKADEKLSRYQDEVFMGLKVKKPLDAKSEKKIFLYFMIKKTYRIPFQILP